MNFYTYQFSINHQPGNYGAVNFGISNLSLKTLKYPHRETEQEKFEKANLEWGKKFPKAREMAKKYGGTVWEYMRNQPKPPIKKK